MKDSWSRHSFSSNYNFVITNCGKLRTDRFQSLCQTKRIPAFLFTFLSRNSFVLEIIVAVVGLHCMVNHPGWNQPGWGSVVHHYCTLFMHFKHICLTTSYYWILIAHLDLVLIVVFFSKYKLIKFSHEAFKLFNFYLNFYALGWAFCLFQGIFWLL